MKSLDWDYTHMADAYLNRPDYAEQAVSDAFDLSGIPSESSVLDLGAGVGHLTLHLVRRFSDVWALEPNDSMSRHGKERTAKYKNLRWVKAVMQETGLPDRKFELVTFGSSFGVADHQQTLREASRILKPGGWIICMFNHRDLSDPLQLEIENYIKLNIPRYGYGDRRTDQAAYIESSGLFGPVEKIEAGVTHQCSAQDWINAWSSHATLQHQAGEQFEKLVHGIGDIVTRSCEETIIVPYVTRVWAAKLADR